LSGLCGLVYFDGRPVEQAELEQMSDRLAHRGPDAAGQWRAGSAGLGHRMLWTTPESLHERLPLASADGGLVITADVRIDNRDELFRLLALDDRSLGDSALILAAYAKWGERCPEHLLGDFAFAIWDARDQTLFCARDHLGVKPFFYFWSAGFAAVASEIKGLLALPQAPRRLNERRVAEYLASLHDDTAITFYQDIHRLPPAHSLTLDRAGTRLRRYWALDPAREAAPASDEEYAAEFRQLFTEAVHCRLRSAYPVGAMLSGGLDSSSIVCVARQLNRQSGAPVLHTFSAIFDTVTKSDERQYIQAVVAGGDLTDHYVHPDQVSPLVDLERMLWHSDEPFLAPNLFIHWEIFRSAQAAGMRVMLDGIDGDTTISHGLAYLPELIRTGHWRQAAAETRGLARNFGASPRRVLMELGLRPLMPLALRRAYRVLKRRTSTLADVDISYAPAFVERVRLAENPQLRSRLEEARPRNQREEHWRSLNRGLIPFTLEVADRAAAAFGLESRNPFYDRRLVEYCLALPGNQKLYQGWSRMVLRRAMAGVLPEAVCWRRDKSNLGPNFRHVFTTFERVRLQRLASEGAPALAPYMDNTAVRAQAARYLDRPTGKDEMGVWKTLTLAEWLEYTAPAFASDEVEQNLKFTTIMGN
jgi:asparagine synthase (glutamine-hydrolysing)